MSETRDLTTLACSDFAGRVGEAFQVALPSGESLETRLAEATEHPHLPAMPGLRRGFSIVLQSSLAGHLPQAITHAELGVLELFLVPIGPQGPGMRYEAVFN